jgi:hypothetical protein
MSTASLPDPAHTPTGQELGERCQPLVRLASVAGDFWNHAHNLLGTLKHLAATDPDAAVLHTQTELLIADYDQAKAAYDQAATAQAAHTPTPCHGPYEYEPVGTFLAPARRAAMRHEALDGVTLGTWDQRILAWLCPWSDTPTFLAILGWIERARHAGSQSQPQVEGGRRC